MSSKSPSSGSSSSCEMNRASRLRTSRYWVESSSRPSDSNKPCVKTGCFDGSTLGPHEASTSCDSESSQLSTFDSEGRNCENGFPGSLSTFDLDRYKESGLATIQSAKASTSSRELCEVHSVASNVDVRRQCCVDVDTKSKSVDNGYAVVQDLGKSEHRIDESLGSFHCSSDSCSITNSDSASTLKADSSTTIFKGGGDSALESLGYFDDDWNGNYELLYDWIDKMNFVKNQKNVHRDFSDGVLMAELLKKLWPKMVDLHNYSTANSFNNKLANWTTLNSKVLRRIKLAQPQTILQELAKAEPGVLETLLAKIKRKYERSKLIPTPRASVSVEEHSTIVLNGQKMHKDQLTVMMDRCKHLEEDLAEGDEVIKILRNKLTHLEFLLQDKDAQIADLKSELSRYQFGPVDTVAPPPSCVSGSSGYEPRLQGPSLSNCTMGTAESLRPGCYSCSEQTFMT